MPGLKCACPLKCVPRSLGGNVKALRHVLRLQACCIVYDFESPDFARDKDLKKQALVEIVESAATLCSPLLQLFSCRILSTARMHLRCKLFFAAFFGLWLLGPWLRHYLSLVLLGVHWEPAAFCCIVGTHTRAQRLSFACS